MFINSCAISTRSIQCSHFGALNLSYTLPSLSCQVTLPSQVRPTTSLTGWMKMYQVGLLIFPWVKWNIWAISALPTDTTSEQCPNIERGETWYFSENPAASRIRHRTVVSDIGKAPRSILPTAPCLMYTAGADRSQVDGIKVGGKVPES